MDKSDRLIDLAHEIHQTAQLKGWYDREEDYNFERKLLLVISELMEAYEEFRKGKELGEVYYSEGGKPEGIPIELADALIRILDLGEAFEMYIPYFVRMKMNYNETRPYRHGNKKA